MIQQTIFPFKMAATKEAFKASSGSTLFAEYNHGIGLRELADKYCRHLAVTEDSNCRYL